jgi:hypothetical protein
MGVRVAADRKRHRETEQEEHHHPSGILKLLTDVGWWFSNSVS